MLLLGGYWLIFQTSKTQLVSNPQPPEATPEQISDQDFTPTPAPESLITLAQALAQSCRNGKIGLSNLPFRLSDSFRKSYLIDDVISCQDLVAGDYAEVNSRIERPGYSGYDKQTFFYHAKSTFEGMADPFAPLSQYMKVTISGQDYWLSVKEPGPYGISSLGLWFELIGQKVDSKSGTIVRVIKHLSGTTQSPFADLIVKYGERQDDTQADGLGIPEYIVTNQDKKKQLMTEIAKLAPTHPVFIEMAKTVQQDLNGVEFN